MAKMKFNISDCAVDKLFMSTVSWHDPRLLLAQHIIVCSAPVSLLTPTEDHSTASLFLVQFKSVFVWLSTALGTFTSPGNWLKPLCPWCLSFSHRQGDVQGSPAPDTHTFHSCDFVPLYSHICLGSHPVSHESLYLKLACCCSNNLFVSFSLTK